MEHGCLVVVGGTAAGLSAASRAKRAVPALQVKVFEKTGFVSYGSCGLPYFVGDIIHAPEDLISLTASELREKRGIEALVRHEVIRIDRKAKQVRVVNLDTGTQFAQSYDALVLATGALAEVPPFPGCDAKGVFTLRSVEDGIHLKTAVQRDNVRVVVVGGGLIGLETAETIRQTGAQVAVVEALPRLLPFLPPACSKKVADVLQRHGVSLLTGAMVREIVCQEGDVSGVLLENGQMIEADVVLLSVGVAPNSRLAKEAGLELGVKGSIAVDAWMQTSDPSIYACGDCTHTTHLLTGKPCYIPMGTTANKQGRTAGDSVVGMRRERSGVLGSQVTKVFDLYIGGTGLTLQQAVDAGFDVRECSIVKSDRASYYPGGIDTHLNLVFERKGGRLLGAQATGGESIAGRINVLVAAITAGMTVGQLDTLDLLYSPSVAPVYDPILIAASQALKLIDP